MNLATLLILAIESSEIFKAAQDASSSDEENEGPKMEPLPTQREVLKSAAVLTQFSMAQNDPTACRLEETLRLFTHQVCLEAQQGIVDCHSKTSQNRSGMLDNPNINSPCLYIHHPFLVLDYCT
ncbi:hypothetical protein NUW54_g19 [Trametes sanguinea]|uniref:Uncharacterized protein n=1 Tax=Trametes sanguinea TaxID=158606 RepID=A0ACC1QC82_9APHY|nr:hypothetical protein NUW54_g19 [Trametes sanguinea]